MVVDVYIAGKLNKFGKRFGFVRFIRVRNEKALEKELNSIWNGGYKLFVCIEKFRRKPHEVVRRKEVTHLATPFEQVKLGAKRHSSYADAVKNATGACEAGKPKNTTKMANQDPNRFRVSVESKINTDIVQHLQSHFVARSVQALFNLVDLCNLEGLGDFRFHYLGGRWVLVKCPENFSPSSDPRTPKLNKWFSSFDPWSIDFEVDERLVWLNIEGVPLKVWNPNTFISIPSRWGEVLISEPHWNKSTDLRRGKVCVLSKIHEFISVSEEIQVDGKVVVVRVSEGDPFSPLWISVEAEEEEALSDSDNGEDVDEEQVADFLEEEEDSNFVPDSFEEGEYIQNIVKITQKD